MGSLNRLALKALGLRLNCRQRRHHSCSSECKSGGTRTVAVADAAPGVTRRSHYTPARTQAYGELFSTQITEG